MGKEKASLAMGCERQTRMYSPYFVPAWLRIYLDHWLGALSLCALSAIEMYLGNRDVALVSMLLAIPVFSPDRWNSFSAWLQGLVYYNNPVAREWATCRRLQRVRQFRFATERVSRVLSRPWSGRSQQALAQVRRLARLIRPHRGVRGTHRSRRGGGQGGTKSSGQKSDGGEGGPDGPADVTTTVAVGHDQTKDPSILSSAITGCLGLFICQDPSTPRFTSLRLQPNLRATHRHRVRPRIISGQKGF